MKFLKRIGLAFFLLGVLLIVINGIVKDAIKEEAQARAIETSKPVMTRAAEAVRPAAEAYSKFTQEKFLETMAGGEGPMADGAKGALAQLNQREREANRGPRQSMKDCIKPNGLIDQDVKDCMDGLMPKRW